MVSSTCFLKNGYKQFKLKLKTMEKKYFETVSVEDELPKEDKDYFTITRGGYLGASEFSIYTKKWDEHNVVYWLREIPAPTPPKVSDDTLEKLAEEKYPRTFYDGTLTLDDKNFEIKRNAFIAGANFKAAQSNDDAEMVEFGTWLLKMWPNQWKLYHGTQDKNGLYSVEELLKQFKNGNK